MINMTPKDLAVLTETNKAILNQSPADTRLRWSPVSSTEINKAILCGLFRAESEVSYSEEHGWEVTFYNLTLQQIRRLAELTNGGKIDS